MSVPSHPATCFTKTFKTSCPECSSRVWFYSCSCGSKIYFDDLGPPWPKHNCYQYENETPSDLLLYIESLTPAEILKAITKHINKTGKALTESELSIVENIARKFSSGLQITDIEPATDEIIIEGTIMNIDKINICKKLGITNELNPIINALFKEFLPYKWREVRVRSQPDKLNRCKEYNMILNENVFQCKTFRIRQVIVGVLKPVNLRHKKAWELVEYDLQTNS